MAHVCALREMSSASEACLTRLSQVGWVIGVFVLVSVVWVGDSGH